MSSNEKAFEYMHGDKVRKNNLFGSVVSYVEELLVSGEYPSGSKLPTEKELCETLGTSRTVVREALRAVESKGLVDIRVGSGTYVCEPSFDKIVTPIKFLIANNSIDILDLIQARRFLEPGIAHVAALKCTDDDIAGLRDCLQKMIDSIDSGDDFIRADQEFHMLLAKATQNPVLYIMATTVVESLVMFRMTIYETDGAPSKAIQRHAEILEALVLHDTNRAYTAMEKHIDDAEERQHIRLMQTSLNNIGLK